jgi:hypothetical protein
MVEHSPLERGFQVKTGDRLEKAVVRGVDSPKKLPNPLPFVNLPTLPAVAGDQL